MKEKDQFWKKSYDPGLEDLKPDQWEHSYPEICRQTFKTFPDKTALAFMGVHITFSQLDVYANRFANMLIASGLTKGDVVGINLPNIPEYVIAWLGILRAGCAVSGVSPLLSPAELEYQLQDSRARALVTLDALYEARLAPIAQRLVNLRLIIATSVGGFLPGIKRFLGKLLHKIPTGKVAPLEGKTVYLFKEVLEQGRFPAEAPDIDIGPDDIAYLQYTGGTTGTPKGAMISHRNAVADLLIFQKWLSWESGKGVGLSGFPFFHIAGIFTNANFIYLGWTQILIPNPRDTDHICKELGAYKPTTMANVPPFYMLLTANPRFRTLDHSNLKTCVSAAAPFPEEAQRAFEDIVGKGKILEGYGMTETSPLTIFNPDKMARKLGTIGLPLLNTDVKLVVPETGNTAATGEPGEICIKGPQVMVGYFNKPEETAQVMDADGYLHTGDVAIQDTDGYLRIVDRTKDMINIGGFKVFSRMVEEVLITHPALSMIAVIGANNPERPGSEMVKAYAVLNPDYQSQKDEEALKKEILDFAKARLTPYEVPKVLEIRKELPLTSVGKIDKKVLRKGTGAD
jgi:long-chain acyl-CoA synthetase